MLSEHITKMADSSADGAKYRVFGVLLFKIVSLDWTVNKQIFTLNSGVLNGPDIRKLMRDNDFNSVLEEEELIAWDTLKAVIENVLGSHRSENWRVLVEDMLLSFENIGVRMSLKVHFMHHHQDHFDRQLPSESDEHGERFHQVSAQLEHWYSGKKLDSLLADLCWKLLMEQDDE